MSFGKPGASGALQRELYREDGGEGYLGNAMLNDVLAVCVAGAVVVVIATILGAVELLRKPAAAIAGRWRFSAAWVAPVLRARPSGRARQSSRARANLIS